MISIVRILLLCQKITSLSNYEEQYDDDAHELLKKYVISVNLLQRKMYKNGLIQHPYPVFGNQFQDSRHEPMIQLQTTPRQGHGPRHGHGHGSTHQGIGVIGALVGGAALGGPTCGLCSCRRRPDDHHDHHQNDDHHPVLQKSLA